MRKSNLRAKQDGLKLMLLFIYNYQCKTTEDQKEINKSITNYSKFIQPTKYTLHIKPFRSELGFSISIFLSK